MKKPIMQALLLSSEDNNIQAFYYFLLKKAICKHYCYLLKTAMQYASIIIS